MDNKNRASFTVNCERIAFSRSVSIPLDARGYVHSLSDDLARAIEYYELRITNHELIQTLTNTSKYHESQDVMKFAKELLYKIGK